MENSTPLASELPPDMSDMPDMHGSGLEQCIQAVLAVARRPSRATFATWMRVVEPVWIPRLLVVVIALNMLTGLASMAVSTLIAKPSASPVHYLFGAPSLVDRFIFALIIFPLIDLIWLALAVLGAATLKLTGQEKASIRTRAREILRPYLLAAIVTALVSLVINEPVTALQISGAGQIPFVAILASVVSLATLIYSLVVELNALAAGSGVSRWALIIVYVLAAIVGGIIVVFGLGALLSLVGIHLPVMF